MRRTFAMLAFLVVLVVVAGVVSALAMRWAIRSKDLVLEDNAEDLTAVESYIEAEERAARKARAFLLTGSHRFREERDRALQESAQRLGVLRGAITTPEGEAHVTQIVALDAELRTRMDELLRRRERGEPAEELGRALEVDVQPFRDRFDVELDALRRHVEALLRAADAQADRSARHGFLVMLAVNALALGLATYLVVLLSRAWRQLLAAAEFQQRVVGIVGHDIGSPLAAILASAAHLAQDEGAGERTRRTSSLIIRSGKRIEALARLLVDFVQSRTAVGLALAPAQADAHEVARKVAESMRELHPGREIALETDGDGGADLDAVRVGQALANLVDNALRHGAQHGTVRIVSRGVNPSTVAFEVHNVGAPIPPPLLADIFEPFRHGASPQTYVRESLGLGLFIVAEVARAHSGRVEVRSDERTGTTFTLVLPRVFVRGGTGTVRDAAA